MAQSTVEQPEEIIFELLQNGSISTIVLAGKPGIGKTWLARKASIQAVKENIFDIALWVYLNRSYDERSLHESIARQLSLFSTSKEWEVDDNEEVDEEKSGDNLEVLKQKISSTLLEKRLLLVLDDEGKKMKEEEIIALLHFARHNLSKLLITSINDDGRHKPTEAKKVITMMPFSVEKSLSLLRQRAGSKILEIPGVMPLAQDFAKRNMGLMPAAVVILSKALIYGRHDSWLRALQHSLEDSSGDGNYNFSQLLHSGYDEVPDGVLNDCSGEGSHFFIDRGSLHYSELIAYWILEGYFGHIDCIKNVYDRGHHVLMELMDCHIVKKVEADHVIMERTKLNLIDHQFREESDTASLGLAILFEDGKWDGLGKVTLTDGMIKTICSSKRGQKLSTLLIDGNRLSREVPNDFFQSKQDLKVLSLFNPRLKSLPLSLSHMEELNVLVLRGCDQLVNVEYIQELRKLTVLEISGASSLESIPDHIFLHMTELRSLNLSGLKVEALPSSIYKLTELRWVILKGCSHLKQLQSFKKSEKLTVLDLSGATSLENFPEKNLRIFPKLQRLDLSKTKIRSLPLFRNIRELSYLSLSDCQRVDRLPGIQSLVNLQILDLSGTRIKEFHDRSLAANGALQILDLSKTPVSLVPSSFSNLRHLILKDCCEFKRLPCIKGLTVLNVLDLSGASSLSEIEDEFFSDLRELQVLNLSETVIKGLPPLSTLCNLRQLLLSNCGSLERLPNLHSLRKLEMINLSGCRSLTEIEAETFEQMTRLRRLALCETKIAILPSIKNLSSLRQLLLANCNRLKLEVEPLKTLSNLDELNLCGISSLTEAHFLEDMTQLQSLDLSETLLEQLPSVSNLKNLSHLSLRNCQKLKSVSPLEELTKLEVLDISGTPVRHLPCLKSFRNLRQLLLRDCLNLEGFVDLVVPDVSGAFVTELPYGISELLQLEHLDLPNTKNIQGADERKVRESPEELNQYQWCISNLQCTGLELNKRITSLSGPVFIKLTEKRPTLWETSFKQFLFSIRPVETQNEIRGIYFCKDEMIFRDIYFEDRHFSHFKGQGRLLEILGFQYLPKGIEDVVRHSEYVFLSDNSFIKQIADLGAENIKVLKGCWIERCTLLESVFHAEKEADVAELGKSLEILWVSNAINMRGICSGNLQCQAFQNLKNLYLDCCPKMSSVFSSALMLENLEILHIKFCEKLKTLFEHPSQESVLPKLHTFFLWELPELESTGCILPSLSNLEVGECPMLVNVVPSKQLPTKLKILKIKFCDKLETVFEHSTAADYTLPELHTLHLLGLPELKSIGVKLPCLPDPIVSECPKLQPVSGISG